VTRIIFRIYFRGSRWTIMPAAKFCTYCGTSIEPSSRPFWSDRSACHSCAPALPAPFLWFAVVALLCGVIGYSFARWSRREPVFLIGTPIEKYGGPGASSSGSGDADGGKLGERPASVAPREGICGATTRSGKICQRRVKDGGYCWQHRNRNRNSASSKSPDRVL